jgi:transcriptional regulator with XRE-family HTH domain
LEPSEVLGATVRRLREDAGLTLEQFGLRCDMDLGYISRVERGEKDVQLRTIVRLACGLGVQPARLIEDVRCPDPPVRPSP